MNRKYLWAGLALAVLLAVTLPMSAQAPTTGKIHGHVNDPTGAPLANGTVSLYPGGMASPTQAPKYKFTTDANGDYTGADVAAGSYTLIYRNADTPPDKVIDQLDNVKVTAGADTEANFDMTRADYMAKLTPEERKAVEETKAKNAGIMKENAVIKNLNGDLETARKDDQDKNFADAAALMQKDVGLKPDAPVLWVELGMAQRGLKQWSDCETSLQKGIALDAAAKKPNPNLEGAANDALGECYGSDGKIPEAQAAYDAAAKVNPPGAGMYYQNETIVMSRVGQVDATVAAADKAIAADPNRPIPYYLKGQALVNKATVDPKTQKITAPPGCREAYQKYLQLAPTGPFANDAKSVIASLTATPSTRRH